MHICKKSQPDVVITVAGDGTVRSQAYSVFGLSILFLPYSNQEVVDQRSAVKEAYNEIKRSLGSISLRIPEISDAIGISSLKGTLPITTNIALLVVIALWLALKAHRKVLDYFSHNDVLLPLSAACGKQAFYTAIWILTLFRVACFLGASIPLIYFGLSDILTGDLKVDLAWSLARGAIWIIALVSALGLATVRAQNLIVRYSDLVALNIPRLDLSGRVIALLGHNGAGKSTLIKTILGLLEPLSGSVSFVRGDGSALRPERDMAFCHENGAIFPDISVERYLQCWCRITRGNSK